MAGVPLISSDSQIDQLQWESLLKSTNFEFLSPRWSELAVLGGFAERYASPDPASALVKLRSFCEQVVEFLFNHHGLPRSYQANLYDLLADASFVQAVPRVVLSKLHSLRVKGNEAAHGKPGSTTTAQWMLHEAFDLGRWLSVSYGNQTASTLPTFKEPPAEPSGVSKGDLKRQKKALLEKLAAEEAKTEQLLQELEAARLQSAQAQATVEELQQARQNSEAAVSALDFDEETTRKRLIDEMLADAGWNVSNTEEVGQEVQVLHQATTTGKGFIDYELRSVDGSPLAVIEAKKTAKSAEIGRKQAEQYADGREKMPPFQRPIILYTNGYDIFIWNDAEHEPPRRLQGYPSRESLEYMVAQRHIRVPASNIEIDTDITDRPYQLEAVRRVIERFAAKHRRALIAQATGTGKTRVAVSLCDALVRAKWARRILFLCDRRELRKQADGVFQEFMGSEPRTFVTRHTYKDREHRVYLATYPAMMKVFQSFDVGFFDLIIADESHRSIYNRYRHLFEYFDAYQIGLTATPVQFVQRNTFSLFGCEDQDPTAHFSYEDAINSVPPYLVPFKVQSVSFGFVREGISYAEMTPEQRQQLEDQETEPEAIEFAKHQVDKKIFNKDTNRRILRNLMEHGIHVQDGTRIGKTIVFARNHNHAVLLQKLFDEMYPQFGGKICRVIDHYDPRAEELINDFKDPDHDLRIALSVDMLDTGIDVPEIVNLVFAKPVFSYVKFWQMIGRGTRLCPDLLGPNEDKTHFQIFDHWGNFDYFDEARDESEPTVGKSLLQSLFEGRIELAQAALNKPNQDVFRLATSLLARDIADLPDGTIPVREKWREIQTVRKDKYLKQFSAATVAILTQDVAPLMQWRNVDRNQAAYRLDLLISQLQTEMLKGASRFDDLRDTLLNQVAQLQMNLNPVRAKSDAIATVKSDEFWATVSVRSLEEIRIELRGIMKYSVADRPPPTAPKVIDIEEEESLIERKEHVPKLKGLEMAAYRQRVEQVLRGLFDHNETLQRIKAGAPVSEADLQALISLVLTQDPDLDLNSLKEYYPETADHLDLAIRSIIGLDAKAVRQRFVQFVQKHTTLSADQIRFISLLQNHIARYGLIDLDALYEAPFTDIDAEGIDGVFEDESQIDDILAIIDSFSRHGEKEPETP